MEWSGSEKRLSPSRPVGASDPPFLVGPIERSGWRTYEALRTRRLPQDFRDLATAVFPTPFIGEEELDRARLTPDSRIQGLIESFAIRYGFLERPRLLDEKGPLDEYAGRGESLSFWQGELAMFRSLCVLWDAVQAAESGELGRRQLEGIGTRPEGFKNETVQLDLGEDHWLIDPHEYPGRSLAAVLRDRLHAKVQERAKISVARLVPGRPLRFRPDSLLDAVYLDFAMELVGATGSRLRECNYCHRPYRATRKDSVYCSDTCRSQARHHRVGRTHS